jgi:L-arabinose isomerase
VTEGDKVAAQQQFGWAVNGHGVGDLVARIARATDAEVDRLVGEYSRLYEVKVAKDQMGAVRGQARIEIGLRAFLEEGGFSAFTDTFEDLHGLEQLPGLAVQRLMAEGYGFGAEGDWKTAALVRAVKVMATGLPAGTSFMEDYTYHLVPGEEKILGAHAGGVRPSPQTSRPARSTRCRSAREDPVRLVFDAARSGGRPGHGRPGRPVPAGRQRGRPGATGRAAAPTARRARACGGRGPDLPTPRPSRGCPPAHRTTVLSTAVGAEELTDLAEMTRTELLLIDGSTTRATFADRIRWNQAYYRLAQGL